MARTVILITFKLVKGASVEEYLAASKRLNDGYMSKLKGYISWEQLLEGDLWADVLTFETPEDAQRVLEATDPNPLAEAFYSFLDMESCQTHVFASQRLYSL
jgi:hypothetical protein